MRVNSRVFTERTDMFDGIKIPNCPSQLRTVAENLIMLLTKPGYSVGDYRNITQLDKILTLDYWREYDDIEAHYKPPNYDGFRQWFINEATPADLLTRARRWLIEHNYIIIKDNVQEHATEASNKWRQAVKG